MSRHRDFRNIDYDDYADEDDDYDVGSYGASGSNQAHSPGTASYVYNRNAPTDPAAHHRAQLQPKSSSAQNALPKQTDQSAAFFKTKPAKKGKGSGQAATAAASSASLSSSARAPPGFGATPTAAAASNDRFAASTGGADDLMFGGGDDFEADTAAAIAASLAEANAEEAFHREAGLSFKPTLPTPTKQPLRSQDAARETERALEQLRLDKQASNPKRQVSGDMPAPTRLTQSQSLNSLSASQPTSEPPSPSVTASTPAAASSSAASAFEIGEAPPPSVSEKRSKEVIAAEQLEASLNNGADQKARLNMVVIGHVDAGKSTLMGHLLFLQGRVSQKLLHKYEKESRETGKSSFHFAWVLDETDEERQRGITTDVAVNFFETPTKKITLLDAPGHKEFIPQMITGAAQADAAILVVPATRGEFDAGFGVDGQIREHAVLARSLGVGQLILAVNKLDTCEWAQERYNEIVGQMIPYLKSVGYKEKDLWTIPLSGLTGENIMTANELKLTSWYTGPVLLDLIDRFHMPPRATDKPVRLCIQDVFKSLTLGQTVAGKVETGTILLKDRLLLLPLGETVAVRAMEARGENLQLARAGDNVEIGLKDFSDANILQVGQWLCDPHHPIPMVTHFRAQIITMAYRVPLVAGTQLTFFNQATTEPVQIRTIMALVDPVTGAVTKKSPRVLPRQSTAIVELTAKNRLCLELFRNYRELGRFTLRRGNESVAVGVVIKLFRMQ